MHPIPLVDLKQQHAEIADEVNAGFAKVIQEGRFILGAEVAQFEDAFARFSDAGTAVAVASGSDAIELALRAVGVGPGDEVILPVNSFVATALSVLRAGALPVLVDSDPVFHLIDVAKAADRIGPKTKALLPVHLYGQIAPMEELETLAASSGLLLIGDAAQAQGATRNGVGIGGFGVVSATSFYPGKNLGSYGDAGAVVTNSPEIAERVVRLRNYGSNKKYDHPEIGFNSRMDTLQAVVLIAKLARLRSWNDARRTAAKRYDMLLKGMLDIVKPATLAGNEHVFHQYVIRVPRRNEVLAHLNQRGIGAAVHYPVPIHLQGAFRDLGHRPGDFPVAEAAAKEILSLPMYPHITAAEQERVVHELRRAIDSGQ